MPTGPIEFIGDPPSRPPLAPSEFGGVDGLIQPDPHPMTPGEAAPALARAALHGDGETDPVTGLAVPAELNAKLAD